jgi:cytochrome c553
LPGKIETSQMIAVPDRSVPMSHEGQPMRRIHLLLLPSLVLMAMGPSPDGRTIAHDGNGHGAPACTACHGETFQGTPAIKAPALAGLPGDTILARLAHYAGPTGHNAMMRQVALSLTPAERHAVAGYLSALQPPH